MGTLLRWLVPGLLVVGLGLWMSRYTGSESYAHSERRIASALYEIQDQFKRRLDGFRNDAASPQPRYAFRDCRDMANTMVRELVNNPGNQEDLTKKGPIMPPCLEGPVGTIPWRIYVDASGVDPRFGGDIKLVALYRDAGNRLKREEQRFSIDFVPPSRGDQ